MNLHHLPLVFAVLPGVGASPDAATHAPQRERGAPTAERPYVPPTDPMVNAWESLDPAAAGFDVGALADVSTFLQSSNTRAFIVLHEGRIIVEEYFGSWSRDRLHPVFSVTKSMVSTLVQRLAQENRLRIGDTVTSWLGAGWSNAPAGDEAQVTLRHLVQMTSGLDETFRKVAEPGTVWLYNTPVYRELWDVIEAVTQVPREQHADEALWSPIGMHLTRLAAGGEYALSTARDLARFGLLLSREGRWDRDTYVLQQPARVRRMTSSSQALNPAYGHLFWVNGEDGFVLPDGTAGQGTLIPSAPDDMFAALGALDQKVYVVPSRDVVIVRIGGAGTAAGGVGFDELLWRRLAPALPQN